LSRLDWIPNKLKPPRGLEDFQRDWWRNIIDAMFENEMQGYLPKRDDLWRIAGARTRAFWNANCAACTACFNSATVSGQEVIFYRPLLDLIEAQQKKLRGASRARESPSNSHSQSVFDFELQKQNLGESVREARPEKRPPVSAKLADRMERERRSRLTETTKKGLRDYKTHPLEEWERSAAQKTSKVAAG
jgi:hypothetical protein